jgi:hypothetical protein
MSELRTFYAAMTPEVFALLGAKRFGYIKKLAAEEVASLYPGAPQLDPGEKAFVLHAADGTAIFLAGTREAAMANAISHQLEAVSVH